MSTQKKTIKVFMFLLPALITLLGYAAFHDMLFKERPCLINCDSSFSDNEKFKKWLAFLESLRDNPFASNLKGNAPTALDLAFLQNKFSNKHGDYFQRYRQVISDLTNPAVVKEANEERKAPVYLARLTDPDTASDINTQTFTSEQAPEDIKPFIVGSPNDQRRPGGPQYFDNGQKPVTDGGTGSGGDGTTNSGGGTTGGTGGAGGGDGGSTGGGQGGTISTVPVPKAVYLLMGLVIAVVSIRLKRAH